MSEEENHEQKPKGFTKAYRRAEKLIGSQQRLLSLLQKAIKKIDLKSATLKTAKDELLTLVRLVKAYVSGNYRDVALKTILSAIAAIVYFVNPLDVLPDLLIGLGFMDDLTILGYVLKRFQGELDKFVEWERSHADGDKT